MVRHRTTWRPRRPCWGAVLAAGRLLPEVAAILEEADFYRPAHRAIWRAILRLADRGQPTDPVTVLGELDHAGELADVGGGPFLHTLIEAVPTVANAGHYAHLVADTARRRRVIDLGDPAGPLRRQPGRARPSGRRAGRQHHRQGRWPRLDPAHSARGWGRGARVPGRGPARLAGRLRGRRRHRHPDPTRPGWDARPGRAGHRRRWRGRGRAAARLARTAVSVRGRGHGRRRPQERRVHRPDPARGRLRTRPGRRRPARDHLETATLRRIADQAAATAEAAAGKAPASQQEEARAEAIARAAEASNLIVPPMPRWLVDDATPEALAGLLATYGRIALLSPEGDVFDQMAGRYSQAGPNLGVYLKGHAGDLLKVDRRGRPPEYVQRPCLTIGLAVQPEVLRGLAGRPGFGGRGLLARFLYSLPESLVGRRQVGAPSIPEPVADRYALELHALAASLTPPAGPADNESPTMLVLDQAAGELLLGFERELEPRLAAGSGDLAHLAGWAAKLAGATCRLAALLHLAGQPARRLGPPDRRRHLRRRRPAVPGYHIHHARAVFDLMGADPRVEDARWLLDWINRTSQAQFSRRDAHQAARGRFRKAGDLEPALALLEEHGWLRRVDADSSGPRVAGHPPHGSSSTLCTPPQNPHNPQNLVRRAVLRVLRVLRRVATPRAAPDEAEDRCHVIQRERPQPLRVCRHSCPPASDPLRAPTADRRPIFDPVRPPSVGREVS